MLSALLLFSGMLVGDEVVSYIKSMFFEKYYRQDNPIHIWSLSGMVSQLHSREIQGFCETYVPSQRFMKEHLVHLRVTEVQFSDGIGVLVQDNRYSQKLQVGKRYFLKYYRTGLHSADTCNYI